MWGRREVAHTVIVSGLSVKPVMQGLVLGCQPMVQAAVKHGAQETAAQSANGNHSHAPHGIERQSAAARELLGDHTERRRPEKRLAYAIEGRRQENERPVAAIDSDTRPTAASAAQTHSKPNGEMRWTIGPAKKRRINMISEV